MHHHVGRFSIPIFACDNIDRDARAERNAREKWVKIDLFLARQGLDSREIESYPRFPFVTRIESGRTIFWRAFSRPLFVYIEVEYLSFFDRGSTIATMISRIRTNTEESITVEIGVADFPDPDSHRWPIEIVTIRSIIARYLARIQMYRLRIEPSSRLLSPIPILDSIARNSEETRRRRFQFHDLFARDD